MILVTAGTTMPFDELFLEADRLAAMGAFGGERVLCQVGQARHTVRLEHCDVTPDLPSLTSLIAEASLVITHGGATVIQLMLAKKPFIAFPNPRGAGQHQLHFLERIGSSFPISWERDVSAMGPLFAIRRAAGPVQASSNMPSAAAIMVERHGRIVR